MPLGVTVQIAALDGRGPERRVLAQRLEPLSADGRVDALEAAAIETGGNFTHRGANRPARIDVLGIDVSADTLETAAAAWTRNALRLARKDAA